MGAMRGAVGAGTPAAGAFCDAAGAVVGRGASVGSGVMPLVAVGRGVTPCVVLGAGLATGETVLPRGAFPELEVEPLALGVVWGIGVLDSPAIGDGASPLTLFSLPLSPLAPFCVGAGVEAAAESGAEAALSVETELPALFCATSGVGR